MISCSTPTLVNGKWTIFLPEHRAKRPKWDTWEKCRNLAMKKEIRPDDTIVDIGAEYADLTVIYTSWTKKPAVIIEPSNYYWPWIRKIWQSNALPNPLIAQRAFAADSGSQELLLFDDFGWPIEVDETPIEEGGFSHLNERPDIPVITLDQIADKVSGRLVVTVDVEGAELLVTMGARKLLESKRAIFFVSIHTDFMWDRYRHSEIDLHNEFETYGYKPTFLGEDHERHFMYKPEVENAKL